MDKTQQETYERYIDLFAMPVWKEWLETVQLYKNKVVGSAPYEVTNEFQAGQVNGAVGVLDMVLNLEVSMAQTAEESEDNPEE